MFIIAGLVFIGLFGCAAHDLDKAYQADTPEAYREFLKKYPTTEHRSEIQSRMDDAYWREAKEKDSVKGYEEYLSVMPTGKYTSKARSRMDDAYWREARQEDSVKSYEEY